MSDVQTLEYLYELRDEFEINEHLATEQELGAGNLKGLWDRVLGLQKAFDENVYNTETRLQFKAALIDWNKAYRELSGPLGQALDVTLRGIYNHFAWSEHAVAQPLHINPTFRPMFAVISIDNVLELSHASMRGRMVKRAVRFVQKCHESRLKIFLVTAEPNFSAELVQAMSSYVEPDNYRALGRADVHFTFRDLQDQKAAFYKELSRRYTIVHAVGTHKDDLVYCRPVNIVQLPVSPHVLRILAGEIIERHRFASNWAHGVLSKAHRYEFDSEAALADELRGARDRTERLEARVENKEAALAEATNRATFLEGQLGSLQSHVAKIEAELKQKDAQITALSSQADADSILQTERVRNMIVASLQEKDAQLTIERENATRAREEAAGVQTHCKGLESIILAIRNHVDDLVRRG